jgi:hypothetical protein
MTLSLHSFVEYVSQKNGIDNDNLYVVKLPHSSSRRLGDHPNVKFKCIGEDGICQAIVHFLKSHPMVLGYLTHVIVQPQFPYATQAKVSTIICKNITLVISYRH